MNAGAEQPTEDERSRMARIRWSANLLWLVAMPLIFAPFCAKAALVARGVKPEDISVWMIVLWLLLSGTQFALTRCPRCGKSLVALKLKSEWGAAAKKNARCPGCDLPVSEAL
jgi:hypothetical protein